MRRRTLPASILVFAAGAVTALGGFFLLGHDPASAGGGPSSGYGMISQTAATSPSAIREQ